MNATPDTTITQTYMPATKLVAAPCVIATIDNAEKLRQLSQTERAQNAVFYLDDEMRVVDAAGKPMGTLDEIVTPALRERVIPVIGLRSQMQAQGLASWLRKADILDVAVLSDEAALLRAVRRANGNVRAVWDCSAKTELCPSDVVAQANESDANVVVLSEQAATTENVAYLQGRLKTVWVKTETATLLGVADLIASGAYGIWAQEPALVYQTYRKYSEDRSMCRLPLNIAHRGMPISHYENTLVGCLATDGYGATHMEIDLKLTKDGHIVIMHDDDIARTTNGTGNVATMTLEELRRYRVTKNYDGKVLGAGADIPTLEEIFTAFRDKDTVFLLELKTSDGALVTALAQMLRRWPQMTERVVVIAFDVQQLKRMHEQLPHIPTADLNSFTQDEFVKGLLTAGTCNTVPDTGYGNVSPAFLAGGMLARGFMGYCWTYGSAAEVRKHFASGVLGMTNNVADSFKDLVCGICVGQKELTASADAEYVDVVATTYGGATRSVRAKIFLKEERADGVYAILRYRYENADDGMDIAYTLYSRAVRLSDV